MGWLKNYIVFLGSWAVLAVSGLWFYSSGGYDSALAVLASVVGIAANWEFLPVIGGKKRNLTPEQKIQFREKWRPIFDDYFLTAAHNNYRSDAIIHDLNRLDTYPASSEEKGISSWFRIGLMGTYHRGVLLGLRWTYIERTDGKWREVSKTETAMKVALLGEVPFEAIETVNFDGDEFYNKPHIFCHFDYKGGPYARVFYGEEYQLDPGFPYHYREIAEYVAPPRFRWRFWQRAEA